MHKQHIFYIVLVLWVNGKIEAPSTSSAATNLRRAQMIRVSDVWNLKTHSSSISSTTSLTSRAEKIDGRENINEADLQPLMENARHTEILENINLKNIMVNIFFYFSLGTKHCGRNTAPLVKQPG